MAVPAGERSKPKLETLVRAMELASYTLKICSNTKKFKVEYNDLLTRNLVSCATEIYTNAWKANNINVGKRPELKKMRYEYQTKSIAGCYEMLSLIQLSKPVYHLTAKRVRHWGKMTSEVKRMLKAWRESDSKRYADIAAIK